MCDQMNPAIERLKAYIAELRTVTTFSSIEEKASHIGLINQIELAIGNLELCEKHGIFPGSLVSVLPEAESSHFGYRVVHDCESSNPANWEEVLFEGRKVEFSGGDLVIRR